MFLDNINKLRVAVFKCFKSNMASDCNINSSEGHFCINNPIRKKKKQKLDDLKLKNIDIVFLDDSDKIGCIESREIQEKKMNKANFSVNQRIQASFLVFLAVINLIVYTTAFCGER